MTFDGVSGVTATLNTNSNSSPGVALNLAGTYSIGSICVGTVNITTGDAATFTLIPYNKGNSFSVTGQDATYQFTGTGTTGPGWRSSTGCEFAGDGTCHTERRVSTDANLQRDRRG
jgi:hypothetical protein